MGVASGVEATNKSSTTSADIVVGPDVHDDVVKVVVWGVDDAGNVAPRESLVWAVDTVSPVTSVVDQPAHVSQFSSATFLLACDEDVPCTYEYTLNGGPWTAVGGNGTVDGGGASVVETGLVSGPRRVSDTGSVTLVYTLAASVGVSLENATVDVSLVGTPSAWTLTVFDATVRCVKKEGIVS